MWRVSLRLFFFSSFLIFAIILPSYFFVTLSTSSGCSRLTGTAFFNASAVSGFPHMHEGAVGPTVMAGTLGSLLSRMSNIRVVYVTAPSKDVAVKIARAAVESKAAACVNIIPSVLSVYEWEGKLHEDSEVIMIFKTQEQRVEELHRVVMANHTYDVPAFVSIATDAVSSPYAQWVLDHTK